MKINMRVSVMTMLVLYACFGAAQTVFVGSNTVQPFSDYVGAGTAAAFNTVASTSATADTLSFYVDSRNSATNITIGVYNDNAGNPGNLLASGVISSPVNGAWNSVSIPTTTIISGVTYWLALLGNGGTPIWRDSSNCSAVQTTGIGSLTNLPPNWPKGTDYQWCNPSFYAYYQGAQIAVTISPTSATVAAGSTQQFAATVSNCDTNCGVNWSSTGNGSVDLNGLYTAPPTPETDTVTVAAQADLTKKASASVAVTIPSILHKVTLNWHDSDTVTFNVYRGSTWGGPYRLIASGLSALSYADSAVQSGNTYYYVVTAFGSSGESAYSNQVQAVVP